MMTDRFCAVFATAATLVLGSAGHAQQRFPVPPPPPPSYHPIPGPYLIMVDARGEMADNDQMGIIDNVWSSWRGPKLEAYSICYFQTSSSKLDWKAVFRGLNNVSAALKSRGAVVFTPATRICDAAHPSVPLGRSYVQIVGVIRT